MSGGLDADGGSCAGRAGGAAHTGLRHLLAGLEAAIRAASAWGPKMGGFWFASWLFPLWVGFELFTFPLRPLKGTARASWFPLWVGFDSVGFP